MAWVLGFGAGARVLGPPRLAGAVLEQAEEMRASYAPPLPGISATRRARGQKALPFKKAR
jgi:hypothetical protein